MCLYVIFETTDLPQETDKSNIKKNLSSEK